MSKGPCTAYCDNFVLLPSLRPGNGASVQGIGGRRTSVGTALIEIPFTHLHLLIDVNFLIILEEVPSLLSLKDMADNGLDISI